jgi:hypothetical protein
LKAATAGIFVAATLGSTVALKGSSPPDRHQQDKPPVVQQADAPAAHPGR